MNPTHIFPDLRNLSRQHGFGTRAAFTLVELVAVLAILGILAAVLVPVVGRAQETARRAQVRAQFAQWAVAMEAFRSEYGYFPNFATAATAPLPSVCRVNDVPGLFFQTLAGRRDDGGPPDLPRALAANPRRLPLLTFPADELTAGTTPSLCDAFGNTDIVVLLDRDGDGVIALPDPVPGVSAADSGRRFSPPTSMFPDGRVRGSVLFYSAGAGRSPEDIVYSWR